MLIGKSRRWLFAAVLPLVLAACTSQGLGTGTAGLGGSAPRRPAVTKGCRRCGTCG